MFVFTTRVLRWRNQSRADRSGNGTAGSMSARSSPHQRAGPHSTGTLSCFMVWNAAQKICIIRSWWNAGLLHSLRTTPLTNTLKPVETVQHARFCAFKCVLVGKHESQIFLSFQPPLHPIFIKGGWCFVRYYLEAAFFFFGYPLRSVMDSEVLWVPVAGVEAVLIGTWLQEDYRKWPTRYRQTSVALWLGKVVWFLCFSSLCNFVPFLEKWQVKTCPGARILTSVNYLTVLDVSKLIFNQFIVVI